MNPSIWQLTNITSGITHSFAEWSIEAESVQKVSRSQAVGTLTFRQIKAFDATLDFSVGNIIRVTCNGVGWFYGRVIRCSPAASGAEEGIVYEVADPWWWLNNLIFQQNWNIATDPNSSSSALTLTSRARIILGMDETGTPVLTGPACTAAAQYAIGRGAPFTIGETFTGIQIPSTELIDMSCGEIIRTLIRWTPNVCTAWDYSGAMPVLNFKQRSAQSAISLAATDATELSITPRNDLLLPGVVVHFEQEHQLNEVTWRTITTQQSGSDTFGTLVLTIELGGSVATLLIQSITTAPIDAEDLDWWITKVPWLDDATGPDGTGTPTFSDGTVTPSATKEITDGATPPWLADQSARVVVTAKVSYKMVNADNGTEVIKLDHPIEVQVNGTTLTTGTYQRLLTTTPAEDVPSGVAAGVYAAVSVLHYEGEFVRIAEELTADFSPGDLLNVTGGRTEWTTMSAQIQEVVEEPGMGRTTLRFGPPSHLTPQDFIELARMNRARRPGFHLQERIDGVAQSLGGGVEGPRLAPNDAPAFQDTGETRKVIAQKSGADVKKITLDIADILSGYGTNAEIKLRELDYCDGTTPKKIMVLCSLPITPP